MGWLSYDYIHAWTVHRRGRCHTSQSEEICWSPHVLVPLATTAYMTLSSSYMKISYEISSQWGLFLTFLEYPNGFFLPKKNTFNNGATLRQRFPIDMEQKTKDFCFALFFGPVKGNIQWVLHMRCWSWKLNHKPMFEIRFFKFTYNTIT